MADMSENMINRPSVRRYTGQDVDINYDAKRCIHAALCVTRLGKVFDKDRRPWIAPDNASAEDVAAIIPLCPSGALHYERKDARMHEAVPETNDVLIWRDGPLQFSGALSLNGSVSLENETRMTLCRCGSSKNKPFCDNSHHDVAFSGDETAPAQTHVIAAASGGPLKITALANGSLLAEGNLEIRNESGEVFFTGDKVNLCRCGGSHNKPFCDGSHIDNGFQAE